MQHTGACARAKIGLVIGAAAWVIGQVAAAAPAASPTTTVARPNTVTEYCASQTCHAGIVNRRVMHGPTAQAKCLACHQYDEPREHRFRLASPGERLCGDCHSLKHRTTVHTPVRQGRCTGCHDPHGSAHRAMLRDDPTRGLCLSCHKQQGFENRKFVHGPVSSGACILCHEPHSSWQPKLLTDPPQQLCIGCHSELVACGDFGRHVHAPVKDNCTSCHDAHASDHRYQLRDGAPGLCLSCHKELGKALASSAVVHGATTEPGGCLGCHSPHFSQLPKLQRRTQPQQCLGCHDRATRAADGRELANMASLLEENPQHHGPIRQGACTACHQPHAGQRFRLLLADYPPEFYAPFKLDQYALCFNCHIPDLVLKRNGVGLTRFRKGDLNLHWLHVNQEKGRTCRACHEVHASRQPFHIRQAVPFGDRGWMLEINYEQTESGGRCSPGCHGPRDYDHGGSARLPTTRPQEQSNAIATP
ncbi:cytochrome c3 family protein [Fontivita pretiosa]|uniref:cytochrome c3 family protein n=1 Tax=Fontivita pretiosa TaxID=2989684 RepID=UPI003D17C96A